MTSLVRKSNIIAGRGKKLNRREFCYRARGVFDRSREAGCQRMFLVEKREILAFLLRVEHVENSDEMTRFLKTFRGRGNQLQERMGCLVQTGLDYNVVSSFIEQVPMVPNQTKDALEKKIDCMTNFLGYSVNSLEEFPAYLCYDFERVKLRFRMYIRLREKGAAKRKDSGELLRSRRWHHGLSPLPLRLS
ncbi:hypothetical protein POTOM_049734 [Populus tomentosa]|uniref:Uncharacterized protein n=1 Tax=Populus tomentosa TaxID=118781 RepID=A0A8X8C9E2_POPTO|nr:hypothetical protein POTOM_049734 [Populus tomentosa]